MNKLYESSTSDKSSILDKRKTWKDIYQGIFTTFYSYEQQNKQNSKQQTTNERKQNINKQTKLLKTVKYLMDSLLTNVNESKTTPRGYSRR